jgi:diguanylate cyclase (GGDEF)-like protein
MQFMSRFVNKLPLKLILISPFVIQIIAAVGITGWLSYQNGQKTVKALASELLVQAKYRVKERLDRFLVHPQLLVRSNTLAYSTGKISLDREQDLQTRFWSQIQIYQPAPFAIYIGDERGKFLLVASDRRLGIVDRPESNLLTTYQLDERGRRKQVISKEFYDPRQRPWYLQAIQSNEPIWTEVYPFIVGNIGITTAQTIRDPSGKILGVAAADLELKEIDSFLRTIKFSTSSQIFIMENSGLLVATSAEGNTTTVSIEGKKQQIPATQSSIPLVKSSSQYLQQMTGSFDRIDEPLQLEFEIDKQKHFFSVLPYRFGNREWLVAIVVSAKDFSEQIEANNQTTLLLCTLSLFTSIAIGTIVSQPLMRTISRLTETANRITKGNWEQQINGNNGSQEMGVLVNSFDRMVEHLQQVFKQLEGYAYVDSLTGLPNRPAFTLQIQQAIITTKQNSEHFLAIILLEIDSFAFIENGLGEKTGDSLLKNIAMRLQRCLQTTAQRIVKSDSDQKTMKFTIARIDRDEFAILLENISTEQTILTAAQNILQIFQQPFRLDRQDVVTSASIGVAIERENIEHPDEILRDANIAKLAAKDRGKACYVIFDTLMRIAATERLQLEVDLRYAIDRQELELWYQPVVEIGPHRIAGFEALIRWRHPSLGLIPPDKFIALAEESDVIIEMGKWILLTACRQMYDWQQDSMLQSAFISVNVCIKQLLLPDFVQQVKQVLQETKLAGKYLQLEITESAAVSQPDIIVEKLIYLRTLGVRICIDDFGTGYCNLSHILQLPIDALKIDRSFISDIGISDKFWH